MPRFLEHIQDRDLWYVRRLFASRVSGLADSQRMDLGRTFRLPRTAEFHAALSMVPFSFTEYDQLREPAQLERMYHVGETLLAYDQMVCACLAGWSDHLVLVGGLLV